MTAVLVGCGYYEQQHLAFDWYEKRQNSALLIFCTVQQDTSFFFVGVVGFLREGRRYPDLLHLFLED